MLNTIRNGRCLMVDVSMPVEEGLLFSVALKPASGVGSVNAYLLHRTAVANFVGSKFDRLVNSFRIAPGRGLTVSMKKSRTVTLSRKGNECVEGLRYVYPSDSNPIELEDIRSVNCLQV